MPVGPLSYGNGVEIVTGVSLSMCSRRSFQTERPFAVAELLLQRGEELRAARLVAAARAEHGADQRRRSQ